MNQNLYEPSRADVREPVSDHNIVALASRGTRLIAYILDSIIASAIIFVLMFIGIMMDGGFSATGEQSGGIMTLLLTFVGLVAAIGINIYLLAKNGQTIGKAIMKIKIVRSSGDEADLMHSFVLRYVLNGIIAMIPLYGLIDILFIFNEDQRCIHDRIADTIVVQA